MRRVSPGLDVVKRTLSIGVGAGGLALLVWGCAGGSSSAPDIPPVTAAHYVVSPVHAPLDLDGSESLMDIARRLHSRYGYVPDGEGAPTQSLHLFEEKGAATIVFTTEGFLDDAVAGEQYVVEVQRRDGRTTVQAYGLRYRCYRTGSSAWTKELCP